MTGRFCSIVINRVSGVSVVTLDGHVYINDLGRLGDSLVKVHGESGPVIVDFVGVTGGIALGIAAMATWIEGFIRQGRVFACCAASESERKLVSSLARLPLSRVYSTLSQALRAVNPSTKRPIGEILHHEFGIDHSSISAALCQQRERGIRLGQALIEAGKATAEHVSAALAIQQREAAGCAS